MRRAVRETTGITGKRRRELEKISEECNIDHN